MSKKIIRLAHLSGSKPIKVYDITVAQTHLYYANGCLVSNSKRISMLDVNALLSHGATSTLRDIGNIRGQKNDDYWLQFMQGYTPREPKVPMVYDKFMSQLKAAGINAVRQGAQTHIMALTDKDIDKLAGERRVTKGDTVHFDHNLRPVPGGLFDPKLTGGHGGKTWAAIDLHEPMPNPVMEEPIRHILGLTQKKMEGVLAGTEELSKYGTGPHALAKALDNIHLDRELSVARAQFHSGRKTLRDDAAWKIGVLQAAKDGDLHPRDWMMTKAPVLPPAFRPVNVMGQTGIPLVADSNYLYKELLEANDNLANMHKLVGEKGVGPERLALYHAFKAVTGLGEPVTTKSQQKGIKGVLKNVFGSSPKFGVMQRKLLSSTVDNVGRGVVVPNPDYDMDTVGLPENQAFEVYKRFVARALKRRGMPLTEALRHIEDKTPLARDTLLKEMDERPVYINRAPVLHRFGIMAFRPKLVKGSAIQTSPLIVKGYNMDFDGDQVQYHVPTSDAAVKEAYERLLPSANLLSPADFKTPMAMPGQEYQGGLFHSTARTSKRRPRIFRTKHEALAAIQRGDIDASDPIAIMEDQDAQ